jgi:hypothetical protein
MTRDNPIWMVHEAKLVRDDEDCNRYEVKAPITKYVGGYRLGGPKGIQINFEKKPNVFHRYMLKLCFGCEWVDL